MTVRVGINGFGRIGRLVYRAMRAQYAGRVVRHRVGYSIRVADLAEYVMRAAA